MSYEFIQETQGDCSIGLIKKPKIINLETWEEYVKWKNIRIFPYNSKKERFPFIQLKNKILYAYNHIKYKWFTIFNEIKDFLGCKWNTLNYHLKKIEKKGFPHFIEDRSIFDYIKKFDIDKIAQKRILLIPYETFWALLESYKSSIAEDMLKELHKIDYKRMIEDDNQQTLIEQIKGEKALSQILFEEIDKCETLQQIGLFTYLFKFFPKARAEVRFYDPKKDWEWSLDVLIGNLVLELDGNQHRFKNERFELDEDKDTFNFENGRYVFRRSNKWWERNFKEFPKIIVNFMKNHKELL